MPEAERYRSASPSEREESGGSSTQRSAPTGHVHPVWRENIASAVMLTRMEVANGSQRASRTVHTYVARSHQRLSAARVTCRTNRSCNRRASPR